MRHRRLRIAVAGTSILLLALWAVTESQAAISYTTPGSLYFQDFNGLPLTAPGNASIESVFTDGWQDDVDPAVSTENDISIPGWHLYHPLSPASENGFNGHQRMRFGNGSANTGAFWAFANGADAAASAAEPEKALGSIGSTTTAANNDNLYIGLQLTNNTGQTLTSFTLTYDGEQWRHGNGTSEFLAFAYSTTATDADWFSTAVFTGEAGLNFTPPVLTPNDSAVDGNGVGRVNNISTTVNNIVWAPGTDLWLRWADLQVAGNDDGLAIDDVEFMATIGGGPSTDIFSVMSGLASSPATWSNNEAPSGSNHYRVVGGHTVTMDSHFAGIDLRAQSGSTVSFNATALKVPLLLVDDGATLTETVTGDFALGDIGQSLGTLQLNGNASFNIDASSNFYLDMKLTGEGDLDFNSAAGSTLWLTDTVGHLGTIRFNGTGNQVNITESNGGVGTLEMNSTGANILFYNPLVQADAGTIVFNQPGTIDHGSTTTSPLRRLHGASVLVANAPIIVDLTKGFPNNTSQTEERRYLVGSSAAGTGLKGSANITINGMAFNPTAGSITLNEFETGSTPEPGTIPISTYSGTITVNDFVNVEIRQNMRSAKFVVNSNSRLEMGNQVVAATKYITLGEVVVNSGGILEVGFEQGPISGSPFFSGAGFEGTGHHAYHLALTSVNGQNGSLTLNSGSTLRLQVNGTAANQFDSIAAQGNVMLGGSLNVLINPPSTQASPDSNPIYSPAVGDMFDIITITPPGDYDGNGSVGPEDYTTWRAAFGTGNSAADGNGDGSVDAADYVFWRKQFEAGTGGGTITGTFSSVDVTDPFGNFGGFNFQVLYSPTKVQLKVVSAGGGALAAVPEPSTVLLVSLTVPLLAMRRRSSC